jgi:predicted RNA-binding Zn ribbon-like protein
VDLTDYLEGAEIAADLVNTRGSVSGREYLADTETLRRFMVERGLPVGRRPTRRDLEQVRALRTRLRAVFEAPDEAATAQLLNEHMSDADVAPRLSPARAGDWRMQFLPRNASVANELIALSAVGLAALVAHYGRRRLGICAADRCRDVFVDTSRNRSRRYCDETCSTRTNVAAFRARHASHRR